MSLFFFFNVVLLPLLSDFWNYIWFWSSFCKSLKFDFFFSLLYSFKVSVWVCECVCVWVCVCDSARLCTCTMCVFNQLESNTKKKRKKKFSLELKLIVRHILSCTFDWFNQPHAYTFCYRYSTFLKCYKT